MSSVVDDLLRVSTEVLLALVLAAIFLLWGIWRQCQSGSAESPAAPEFPQVEPATSICKGVWGIQVEKNLGLTVLDSTLALDAISLLRRDREVQS